MVDGFSAYILSIVGIILLGTIIDLILVEGQMQKYIKSIFVIFVVFVIIAPIPKLLNIDYRTNFSTQDSGIEVDTIYVDKLAKERLLELERNIARNIESKGIYNTNIKVVGKMVDYVLKIEKIEVDIKKIVIDLNGMNINKYETIKRAVRELVDISEGDIVIYE